mgnify:CR=1 FL=1
MIHLRQVKVNGKKTTSQRLPFRAHASLPPRFSGWQASFLPHSPAMPITSLLPIGWVSVRPNMEYGDSSPFSGSSVSRCRPPWLESRLLGGLPFPAEAGTPTCRSHLEKAPGRLRRSTLRVDSVRSIHDSEIGTHRCGHNPPVSPEGTSLSKPRVEPMRGTSEAQPWVTRTTQNRSPKGWP